MDAAAAPEPRRRPGARSLQLVLVLFRLDRLPTDHVSHRLHLADRLPGRPANLSFKIQDGGRLPFLKNRRIAISPQLLDQFR